MKKVNRKIIVIDDDKSIWNAYQSVLCYTGAPQDSASSKISQLLKPDQAGRQSEEAYALSFASQGQEGLALVEDALSRQEPFSVAFIDIRMPPGWDGMETAARIRAIDPFVEIVIVTAYADRSREEIVSTVGAPDKLLFLRKPFDPEELYQFALSLTEKWQLVQDEIVAVAALANSEARFRDLVETTSDFVWEVDGQGVFTYCSPVCEDIYGYLPDEMIGKPFYDILMAGDHAVQHKEFFDRCVCGATGFQSSLRTCSRKDGREIIIEVSAAPIIDANGKISGFRGIDRDITERIRVQEEKRQLEEQYHQAQKMEAIGTLAGGIAHDLNNVLTPIFGYSRICQIRLGKDNEVTRELGLIEQSADRAAALIRQILAFSRKQVLSPEVCNINLLIKDFVLMLRRMIREDIELALELADDLWPVNIDTGQLEQILINLVVNARDAMTGQGRVVIRTANVEIPSESPFRDVEQNLFSGDKVVLEVSDNGSGMDETILKRMFDPFFTTKEVGKGTGLGLATVFGVAKQHKGHILVKSELGQGSSFFIYFPRSQARLKKGQAKDSPIPVGGTETILLAEDDETVRDMTSYLLKSIGYKVLSAVNGVEAYDLFNKVNGHIDLLLTDVVMPGQGGSALATTLRQERPGLPVLFISGYPKDMAPKELVRSVNADFIQKPFNTDLLALKVRELLDGAKN